MCVKKRRAMSKKKKLKSVGCTALSMRAGFCVLHVRWTWTWATRGIVGCSESTLGVAGEWMDACRRDRWFRKKA